MTSPTSLSLEGERNPGKSAEAVRLVGKGTLGPDSPDSEFVHARLLDLQGAGAGTSGRYGWWIGDESLKARVMADEYEVSKPASIAENIFRHQSAGSTANRET